MREKGEDGSPLNLDGGSFDFGRLTPDRAQDDEHKTSKGKDKYPDSGYARMISKNKDKSRFLDLASE